jgi:hypothetical protein
MLYCRFGGKGKKMAVIVGVVVVVIKGLNHKKGVVIKNKIYWFYRLLEQKTDICPSHNKLLFTN